MKSALFFIVIIALGCIAFMVSRKSEGFQDADLAIPESMPPETPVKGGKDAPFAPPTTALLAPPIGQIASVNSYPDTDPALQKGTAGRIQSLHTSIDQFLKRESAGLAEIGDPSVQLPLSTAKADGNRLFDELQVLKRNPGLEATLTQEDLDGMEANLNYLKKKWRLSANALGGEGSEEITEGFSAGRGTGLLGWLFGPSVEPFQSSAPATATAPATAPATAAATAPATTNDQPTLNDLKDLSSKISIEITRLNASGSTDPLIAARVTTLTTIQKSVDDIIKAVQQGQRSLNEVSLTRSDIAKFLPVMSNFNSPIPAITDKLGAPQALNNLFQSYSGDDTDSKTLAQELFNKYANDIFRNLSWSVNLNYTGNAEQEIAQNQAAAASDARAYAEAERLAPLVPRGSSLEGRSVDSVGAISSAPAAAGASGYRGLFDTVVRNAAGELGPGGTGSSSVGTASADALGSKAPTGQKGPSQFEWKPRSIHICQQIAARGFDPNEFGCLANPDKVSEGFSWRGYTKMICNRIATIYDPGVPEACGCPSPNWAGWSL